MPLFSRKTRNASASRSPSMYRLSWTSNFSMSASWAARIAAVGVATGIIGSNATETRVFRSTFPGFGATLLPAEELRHLEGQIDALAAVQARVAHRLVALVEMGVEDLLGPAEALGD